MLEIKDLTIHTKGGAALLDGLSLTLQQGQALALTGQSGAGKTTLLKAVLGLLGQDQRIKGGAVVVDGVDMATLCAAKRRSLCGTTIGFVPQSPMTAFDGRLTIGRQMEETLCLRFAMGKIAAQKLALETLDAVHLKDARRVFQSKPGELSGGMLQRVTVAMLLAMQPRYILADEPTSALDEENRDGLLSLLQNQLAQAGILLVTHDAHAMRFLCQETVILAAGTIIERQQTQALFEGPIKPWTQAFVGCSLANTEDEFLWKAL